MGVWENKSREIEKGSGKFGKGKGKCWEMERNMWVKVGKVFTEVLHAGSTVNATRRAAANFFEKF